MVHWYTTPPPPRCTTHHFLFFRAVENLYKSLSGSFVWVTRCRSVSKPATDIPEIGRTVEKTTVTRVLPSDPLTGERRTPDFWEYTEKLSEADWQRNPKHTLYIYRRNTDAGPMIPLERLNGFFPVPGSDPVSLNDREELEIALAQKYGGGTYRLILKKGSERITEGRISVDGPPKNTRPGILDSPEANPNAATVSTGDPSSDVAKTAMNLVANHEGEGMRLGMEAMKGSAEIIQRLASQAGNAPPTSTMDELLKQAMILMMQRAMNPPDPLELITRLLPLLDRGGGSGTGGAPNSLVDKILETGLERVLNPAPSGPISSTGAALVSQLPQIAGYVTEAVREWRVGSEAQLQTAHIMAANANRPALPAVPGTVQPPPGPVRPITQATQVAPPAAQAMPPGAPSLEFIEEKIVDILKKPISADEAADEVLTFLDLMAPTDDTNHRPGMVDQLAACSEAQLVQLFQTRPVLKQYHDLARLQEFVRSFLKYAKETEPAPGVDTSSKPN